MSDELTLLRHTLQTLNAAVAVAAEPEWEILFENARFFRWFPTTGNGEGLHERLPDLPVERARDRLANGRPFAYEAEVKDGPRAVHVRAPLRATEVDGLHVVVLEAQDVSKQKEAEYMLDSYSRLVERNTRDLQREKERVEKLLLNIMPRSVFDEMTEYGTVTPQRFDDATMLMLDFVDFTSMTVSRDPGALIAELNDIFTAFDRIVELFGCERLKTIGDAYIAVSGLPDPSPDHAINIARVALRFRRYIERRNASHPEEWRCRIGINTGPVIGSIVGVQKYVYDIFGPGVNLASRLEHAAEPMTIVVSDQTEALIRDEFVLTDLGEIDVKGFGTQRIFSLDGETHRSRSPL
jgi:adenylate cyclase